MARSLKKAVCNFLLWYDVLFKYLKDKGVIFNAMGFPCLPRICYMENLPSDFEMFPISKRSASKFPSKSILCSFEKDSLIYQHVRTIIKAIQKGPEKIKVLLQGYQPFYGISGFDLSVCTNSTIEEQRMYLLLNHMLNAFFAVNGIKILPNIRIGASSTVDSLCVYPRGLCCCTGFLGCFHNGNIENSKAKMLLRLTLLQPTVLVIYGKLSSWEEEMFKDFGMPIIPLLDYNRKSRSNKKEVC